MSNIRKFVRDKQERETPSHKFGKGRIIKSFILVVIIGAVAFGVKLYFDHKKYDDYTVVSTINVENTYNESRYFAFASGFLGINNDGLSYITGSSVKWNQAFELKNPLIDICKDYVVVGEKKSNEIFLCDSNGLVSKLTTTYPIMDLEVSAGGVVYALLRDNDVNHIEILDKNGEILGDGTIFLEGKDYGYPIDCSVSEDGQKLVVSYLYINAGEVQSKIVFYNFSEVGQNEVDRLVGGFNYETTIVPKVEFLNNKMVCAFGDNMFSLYSIKEKPEKITDSDEFDKEVKSIFYDGDYIGIVFANDDTKMPYVMHIYNTSAGQVMVKEFSFNYTDIKFAGKSVLLYNNTSCEIYNFSGTKKFAYTFDKGIVYMIGADKPNRFLVANPTNTEEIKLK